MQDLILNALLILVLSYIVIGCFTSFILKRTPSGGKVWQTILMWPKYLS